MEGYKELIKYIQEAKEKSLKVVLTHGVYDLFHVGHLYSLQKAKELGDILIVGVDSDRLVKIIKGDTRPVIPLKDRMEIVKNIKCVDYVFEVNHDYTEEKDRLKFFSDLYTYLKPDVVAVGKKEYWYDIQKELCKKAGVEYVATGAVNGSTSDIISRL